MSNAIAATAAAAATPTVRYAYRNGFVVADDVVKEAFASKTLSLSGSIVIMMKKPAPCVFFSFGCGGILLADTGLCPIGDAWNEPTREEHIATSLLMTELDPEGRLKLRTQWMLMDLKETEGKILRRPSVKELVGMRRASKDLKNKDLAQYKLAARVDRRRTTAGLDVPDGHEYDSDKDPLTVMFDDLAEKEKRAEKARSIRLGKWPDTPIGREMARMEKHDFKDPSPTEASAPARRGRPPGRGAAGDGADSAFRAISGPVFRRKGFRRCGVP